MRIRRGTLIALIALPLALAGALGWVLWDRATLSEGELQDVAEAAAEELKGADFPGHAPAEVHDVVDEAVEDAAQQKDVPLPHNGGGNISERDSGRAAGESYLMTYYYNLSTDEDEAEDGGNTVCLTLKEREVAEGGGPGLFAVRRSEGHCPE